MTAADVASRCKGAKETASGWTACCPVHEDHTPSLTLTDGEKGVVLCCQKSCDSKAIVAALDLTWSDFFYESRAANGTAPGKREKGRYLGSTFYDYVDETGTLLFQAERLQYEFDKTFQQRQPHGAGGWLYNLKNVRRVLYRLPQTLAAIQAGQAIVIAEGEKAVEALVALGIPATCNPLGAGRGKWRPEFATSLHGAHVIVLPDNDKDGRGHATRIAESLYGQVASLRVVTLPGLPVKGDAVEWIAAGGTREALEALVNATPPWAPEQPSPASPAEPSWHALFKKTRDGQIRAMLDNAILILEHDTQWSGVLGYDDLEGAAVLLARPPYATEEHTPWGTRLLTDNDDREATAWMQRRYECLAGVDIVASALQTIAERNRFHPVCDYLTSLTWDKTPRLDTWLATYAKAEDTAYTREVGAKTLISAVARVMDPGCQVDTMTVLEGAQGIGKSSVWRTLAVESAWFSDNLSDLHTKDAFQDLRGVWLLEFADLQAYHRAEVTTIKNFLSKEADRYRPSFGRRNALFPRQNVFVGSTNKEDWLFDETGNRRFWPVKCLEPCDLAGLRAQRDQLWAEALVRYRNKEAWHLTEATVIGLAQEQQAGRMEEDVWAPVVLDYVEATVAVGGDVMIHDVLGKALHLEKIHWTLLNTRRVGAILRGAGWHSSPNKKLNCRVWLKKHALTTPTTPMSQPESERRSPVLATNDAPTTDTTDTTLHPLDSSENGERSDAPVEDSIGIMGSRRSMCSLSEGAPSPPSTNGHEPPGVVCPHGGSHTWLVVAAGRLCSRCNASAEEPF